MAANPQNNDFYSDLEDYQQVNQPQPRQPVNPDFYDYFNQNLNRPQTTLTPSDSVSQAKAIQTQAANTDFFSDLEQIQARQSNAVTPEQGNTDFFGDLENVAQSQQASEQSSKFPFLPKGADTSEKPNTEAEKKQSNLLHSFQEGLKQSASGEIAQTVFGEYEKLAQEDPGFWSSLVHESGTITGDLPYLAAGATLGAMIGSPGGPIGATVGAGFGATALPAFLKESLHQYRDFQDKGGNLTFGEFLQRADKVANRTLNEGLFGVILGSVKKAIPLLEKTPIGNLFKSKIGQTAATVAGEAAVATAVPAATQGRLPEKEDFAKALALFAGFNLAHLPTNIREGIERQGAKSGLSAEEFAKNYDPEQVSRIKQVVERRIAKEEQSAPPAAKAPEQPKSRIVKPSSTIPAPLQRNLPQAPKEPLKALTELENRESRSTKGRTLDEAISFESPKPQAEPKTEGAFRTAVIDELYPLQRYVEKAGIEDLPITEDPYKMARLYKGWSGKAEAFLDYKTFDPETLKWKGKGLREIIKPYKNDLSGLSKYLVARRAVELTKLGKETGVDIADATQYIKHNATNYEKGRQEIRKYQNDLLDYAEKSGLISPETKQLWQELNQNYVPFQRVIEEPEGEFFGKAMQPKKQFYELKGSKRPIVDPLESIIGNTYTLIRASEQNNVLRSLVTFDKKHKGAGEFIEAKEIGETEPTLKNFYEYLKGEDVVRDDSIRFFDNGKLKTYQVTKEIADVLKGGLKSQELDFLGKVISFPTRLVRTGAITLSPGTLAKLATIDQLEAFLYTDVGYVPYFDMARGLYTALKKPELFYTWKAAGGDQALAHQLSRNIKQQKLKHVAGKKDLNTFTDLASLGRAIESASKPLEESTRLAVFEKALKRKGQSPEALREAALMAREATLDFAKKGAKTRLMSQAIPFFNASIQGADKFWQEVKKNPKIIPKAIATVTLPTLALYYANKDRKEYQELPEWEKDAYWHFYAGEGDNLIHVKMAKPFELGTVFATVPERLAAYANERDPSNINEIGKSLWHTFLPGFIPAGAVPFVETYSNRKLFTGAPIEPPRVQKLPVEERVGPYTSETAKKLSQILTRVPVIGESASPLMVDEWITSMTGGFGSAMVQYTEKALEKTGVITDKVEPEKELSDYPILKNFFGKKGYTTQAASIKKFYDEYHNLEQLYNSVRKASKEGRQNDLPDKELIVARFKQAQRIQKAFSKNFTIIRNIIADKENYTPAEKKILIDQLTSDMVGIARDFHGKND